MQAIAARRSGDAFAHEVLGRVLIALGRKDEAVPELESAARLDPANPEPLELAAELLLDQGRRTEAAAALARAESVRETPTTQALRQRLGPASPPLP
jgi:Flp pilus assembly protein TadD